MIYLLIRSPALTTLTGKEGGGLANISITVLIRRKRVIKGEGSKNLKIPRTQGIVWAIRLPLHLEGSLILSSFSVMTSKKDVGFVVMDFYIRNSEDIFKKDTFSRITAVGSVAFSCSFEESLCYFVSKSNKKDR